MMAFSFAIRCRNGVKCIYLIVASARNDHSSLYSEVEYIEKYSVYKEILSSFFVPLNVYHAVVARWSR